MSWNGAVAVWNQRVIAIEEAAQPAPELRQAAMEAAGAIAADLRFGEGATSTGVKRWADIFVATMVRVGGKVDE